MAVWNIKERYDKTRANEVRSDRAIEMGGAVDPGSYGTSGSVMLMSSSGTSVDFGDLLGGRDLYGGLSASNRSRALFYGGETSGNVTDIDSVLVASGGKCSDHGDLTVARGYGGATSNEITYLCFGGNPAINVIDFGNIASTGNSVDFGNLTVSRNAPVGISSPTRGVFAGGTDGSSPSPAFQNVIDYVTIASTGNAADFGDLSGTAAYMGAANDSLGRGFFIGGHQAGSKNVGATDVFTIASTGNATEFGELFNTGGQRQAASACQGTMAFMLGGVHYPAIVNNVTRFNMITLGNMTDFGDLNVDNKYNNKGATTSHDGIDFSGNNNFQRSSVTYMPGTTGRALYGGGYSGGMINVIEEINVSALGNAHDFGDLTATNKYWPGGCASLTRGFWQGGAGAPALTKNINVVEFSTKSNAIDFGNLAAVGRGFYGLNSSTRGICAGGAGGSPATSPNAVNVIQYITMASFGDASDFGDLTSAKYNGAATSSTTRGVFAGGVQKTPSGIINIMDYITIASTGNAADFGDLTVALYGKAGSASPTRGVFGGGDDDSSKSNVIDYITIASTGNATDFGNLTVARRSFASAGNRTRATWGGGYTPSASNVLDYVTIASTGNAADFGDLTAAKTSNEAVSDSNGGV